MCSDLGPCISDFWGRDVVRGKIIEGLGSVLKLWSCLRGHSCSIGGDMGNNFCSETWKQVFFFPGAIGLV